MKLFQQRRAGVAVLNRDGHTIGLDIGATAVRATVLAPRMLDGRPTVTVHGTGEINLEPGVVVNGVVKEQGHLTAALKQLWRANKFSCDHVILGVANQQVLVRSLTIPDLDPRQRAKALPFQAREVVAMPIDQVVLDFCQLTDVDPETNTVDGLLLATPREPVLDAVAAVERAGLRVARVDLSSLGCLRSLADDDLTDEVVIDLGAHLTTVVIHQRGVPRLVRTLARGGQQLTDHLADRMDISRQDAEAVKRDIGLTGDGPELTRMLSEALRPLVAEIRTSVQYFRSSNEGAQIARLSLTGGGSNLRGVAEALEDQIGLPARVADPMQHIENRHALELAERRPGALSAVSVGLAMGGGSMTTVTSRPEGPGLGGALTAWSIVADLTPPELVESRWVAVLQRRIALVLAVITVLCAAGYTYAVLQVRSATDEAQAANDSTIYLNRSADTYVGITQIETTVAELDAQLATVMADDVDVAQVVTSIRRDLPTSMSMDSISLTLTPDTITDGAATLDKSGRPAIGTVTVSGSGRSLDDLPSFVDGLSAVRGFANVLPTSNQISDGISRFSVAFTLTDQLYSHRYDGTAGASR